MPDHRRRRIGASKGPHWSTQNQPERRPPVMTRGQRDPAGTRSPGGANWLAGYTGSYCATSLLVGNAGAGYDPIFSTVYSLAQKSGGPSLSGTRFSAGASPYFR